MKIDKDVQAILENTDLANLAKPRISEASAPYFKVSVGGTWNHSTLTFNSKREVQQFFDSHYVENPEVIFQQNLTSEFQINAQELDYNTHSVYDAGYSPYIKKLESGDIITVEKEDIGFESIVAPDLTNSEREDILNSLNIINSRYVDYGRGRFEKSCLNTGIQLKYIKSDQDIYRHYYYTFYLDNPDYPDTFIIKLSEQDYNRLLAI